MEVKKPTTYQEQIEKLKSHNCYISDEVLSKLVLSRVNYYRFTAYLLPFRKKDGNYNPVSFEKIYRIYEFDRKIRALILGALEEIEIYLRTTLAYFHAHKYGPLGYMDSKNYNQKHKHDEFLKRFQKEISDNQNRPFVKHHLENRDGDFPIWVAIELFSFGMLSRFYSDLKQKEQRDIANSIFKATNKQVRSWIYICVNLRNRCAHFERLYYQIFSFIPEAPSNYSKCLDRSLFGQLIAVSSLYPDTSLWNNGFIRTLDDLLAEYYGSIQLSHIGFPENWEDCLRKR